MRMADLPSLEVTTLVDAAPEVVWRIVSDVTRVGGWGGECTGAEWIGDVSRPEPGARFLGRQQREDTVWETTSTVIEAEPAKSFAWAVGDPANASATWRFAIAPEGAGTRLVYSAVMGPGPSGLTAVIAQMPGREEAIVAGRLKEHRRNMTTTLEAIKAAAEGAAA